MNCRDAREQLLDAEPADLRAGSDRPLAGHLVACERCRAIADGILDQTAALATGLGSLTPRVEAATAIRAAGAEAARRRRQGFRLTVAGLAAAAAVVLVAISLRPATSPPPGPAVQSPPFRPLVEAQANQSVIVYQTANPDIVVVWLYQRKGS
ncbi:MAG: hypothetical protein AB7S39_05685 [Gemmatimonadales bacterium]